MRNVYEKKYIFINDDFEELEKRRKVAPYPVKRKKKVFLLFHLLILFDFVYKPKIHFFFDEHLREFFSCAYSHEPISLRLNKIFNLLASTHESRRERAKIFLFLILFYCTLRAIKSNVGKFLFLKNANWLLCEENNNQQDLERRLTVCRLFSGRISNSSGAKKKLT